MKMKRKENNMSNQMNQSETVEWCLDGCARFYASGIHKLDVQINRVLGSIREYGTVKVSFVGEVVFVNEDVWVDFTEREKINAGIDNELERLLDLLFVLVQTRYNFHCSMRML